MNLVKIVENGFIIRLPLDYILGYIPLSKLIYHQFTIGVSTLKKYNVKEMYLLASTSDITVTDFLFPYLSIKTITSVANDKLVRNNELNCYNYVFDDSLFDDSTNIFGYFVTCGVKDLICVELYINETKLCTYDKTLLTDFIIGENLLWIPMCNSHGEITKSTNMLHTFRLQKFKISISFKNLQNGIISINPCNYTFIGFRQGMAYLNQNMFEVCTFEKYEINVIIEDNYLIKKNKTTYFIHNFQKKKELVIFGELNNYTIDYINKNNIGKIIIFNTNFNNLVDINIKKLKIMTDFNVCNLQNFNNLPNTLEKLYVRNLDKIADRIMFTNLPLLIKKIKLYGVEIDEKSKIPFGVKIVCGNK